MELSKLVICREDVIIVSDTESGNVNVNRKKKLKTKCVRKVKLTKMTINRIVPNCYRERCTRGQHYHRQTSKNKKYTERKEPSTKGKFKESEAPSSKNIVCKAEKSDNAANIALRRNLLSPITIASSSDLYENISSCSFLSSDSDELEDLINITRKRMKNDSGNFNDYRLKQSMCATINQDDYQNISSSDDLLDSSIHSMDTVLLYNDDTKPVSPRSPDHIDILNNNSTVLHKGSILDSNKLLQKKVPNLSSQDDKDNLSPLYEISGKVFMEHYLNTSLI